MSSEGAHRGPIAKPGAVNPVALDHAWHWFEYHANQRMTMIRFYLVVAGAIASGAGYLWIGHENLLSAILSAFGAVASFCFMRLDMRVSSLVKLGEDALHSQQTAFAGTLKAPAFEICRLAGDLRTQAGRRRFFYPYTYGENLRILFVFAALIFVVLTILNVVKLVG